MHTDRVVTKGLLMRFLRGKFFLCSSACFETEDDMISAIKKFDGKEFNGRPVKIIEDISS
jgi:RNA recognition motif-containing protein